MSCTFAWLRFVPALALLGPDKTTTGAPFAYSLNAPYSQTLRDSRARLRFAQRYAPVYSVPHSHSAHRRSHLTHPPDAPLFLDTHLVHCAGLY
jgi:hypothetical protein